MLWEVCKPGEDVSHYPLMPRSSWNFSLNFGVLNYLVPKMLKELSIVVLVVIVPYGFTQILLVITFTNMQSSSMKNCHFYFFSFINSQVKCM